ncbi:ThuA domain-containing protein [Atrimonas thermophila]|uniref:ThuA domain-containing protein n=1 Tax=Atrimonas thermophila TaxID=3064161 RepID=UPI00399C6983
MKKALIVHGGWEGHDPIAISQLFCSMLEENGFEVEVANTLEAFQNEKHLLTLDLIIPHWTMGTINREQLLPVLKAVSSGVGIAGVHGGMCDSFHDSIDWHFLTGGQWVAHPGGPEIEYEVHFVPGSSPIVNGLSDFKIKSEQYYMHVDPGVNVLAFTIFPIGSGPYIPDNDIRLEENSGFGIWNFEKRGATHGPHVANGPVEMPVVWTKFFGRGRVFYCSIGHSARELEKEPLRTLLQRGFLWAAEGKYY